VHGDDKANRRLLLQRMQDETQRTAYFVSAVAVVFPDGRELVTEGKTYGTLLLEEVGSSGFGYDSIFFSDDLQKSFGVATAEEKNAVSHRFRALQALRARLQELKL
jgi:XTP/dITP diphosphohydrolase